MWILLACAEAPPTVIAPEVHTWEEEARLVVDGLGDVVRLAKDGQVDAARTKAENVYHDRWEPRLEPAAVELRGPVGAARLEYAFGQLLVDLDGNRSRLEERVRALETEVHAVAAEATRAYPPAGQPAIAGPAVPAEATHPLVPEARPNWDADPSKAAETVKVE